MFEALFFGVLGIALSLVGRLRVWPLAAAACWALVEFAYARIPFDGFGWTRIAYAAVDTPLSGLLPLVGVAGVSFAVALVGQLIAWIVLVLWQRRADARSVRHSSVRSRGDTPRAPRIRWAVIALVVLAVGPAALRFYQVEPTDSAAGSVNVAIVQGNIPGRGIEALGRARSVTNNHLSETVDLMTRVRLGQESPPDFVLWPENSTDIDPTKDALTRLTVDAAARVAGTPIMVGAVMQGPGEDERQTTALWWEPGRGPVARYDKRNLVPFGEWIPFRAQLKPLIPILEKVGAQSVPGTTPGVLQVQLNDRPLAVGDVICFELAYDRTVYEAVAGSQILMVQSNNATYGGTGQIEQQFAITRARAMEARREIAVATTNSVSGYIDRNGRVVRRTAEFTADSFVMAMPLRSALTPALRVAPWLERGLAGLAVACCVAGVVAGRRSRPSAEGEAPVQPSAEGEAPVQPSAEGEAPVQSRVEERV